MTNSRPAWAKIVRLYLKNQNTNKSSSGRGLPSMLKALDLISSTTKQTNKQTNPYCCMWFYKPVIPIPALRRLRKVAYKFKTISGS
jgi:hypothetical protein